MPSEQPPAEIACDESGFSGTNLLDPRSPVLAHASVRLSIESARRCLAALGAGGPGTGEGPLTGEYKSNHLFRRGQATGPARLLGPSGPLHGRAHVHLTDKTLFVVGRLVDVLVGSPSYASGTSLDPDGRARTMTLQVHRAAPEAFGSAAWRGALRAFVAVLRARREAVADRVDSFLLATEALRPAASAGVLAELVGSLRAAGPRLAAARAARLDDLAAAPPLEPMIPALIQTVLFWGARGRAVAVVHDEQSALTGHRIAAIQQLIAASQGRAGTRPGALVGVRQVDSRADPRIQIADFIAGAARRIATAELRAGSESRVDPRVGAELTAIVRPYIDAHSIWAHGSVSGSWRLGAAADG